MELWLGPGPGGSCFDSREALVAAWAQGRGVVMRLWARGGRRPQGFYEFEYAGERPPYAVERSTLWRAGVLADSERTELEAEWRREYEAVRGKGVRERREHLEHCDVPHELIEAWTAARRRPSRHSAASEAAAPEAATVK